MMSGTPGFQLPEQLMAQVIDEQADVYAFGVLLIELYGEKPVWEGLTLNNGDSCLAREF